MSTDRGQLADILYRQGAYCGTCDYESRCGDCDRVLDGYAAAILAAGFRPLAQVIETAEQADILPNGSIVTDREGDVWQYRGGLWCSYETAPCGSVWLMKYRPLTFVGVALPRGRDHAE